MEQDNLKKLEDDLQNLTQSQPAEVELAAIPTPVVPEIPEPPKSSFLTKLAKFLLLISFLAIAAYFAGTYVLNKKSAVTPTPAVTSSSAPTTDPTANWKTYPPSTTIGLPYTFRYPATSEMVEAQDLVYFKSGNGTIYHRYLGKQTDLGNAMNNFKPWGTNEQVVFSKDKKQVNYGLLSGYKLTSNDGNNTFLFLESTKLNGILVFHYPTVETLSEQLLDQILSTFKFLGGTFSTGTVSGKLCYPSEGIPSGKIVAKNITSGQEFNKNYAGTAAGVGVAYIFNLDPGTYHLKFEAAPTNIGYYTECARNSTASVCDLDVNHKNINVLVVESQETKNVDLCDFYATPDQSADIEATF
ncbi:MAG: hypothetical protein AAB535_01975 [Patescibacteria group bacterium]